MSVPDWMIDAPQASVDDLAALVRRLARALRKAAPDNDLPDQAVDYLRRHHLDGSVLRATPPAQAADSTEPVACKRCAGKGHVDDGEINHFSDGTPYANGPIKCVKDCPACNGTGRAPIAAEAVPPASSIDPAFSYASSLATALFKKHFAHEPDYASGEVVWGLCDTTAGILTQIDNMVCGLVKPAASNAAEPAGGEAQSAALVAREACFDVPAGLSDAQIERAAEVLAGCMDYPWEAMPAQGKRQMRRNAQSVIDAALAASAPGAKGEKC